MLSRAGERAFTLIEVVVATALLALVAGLVVYAITNLGSANDSLSASRAAQRDTIEAMEQLRTDLGAARSPAYEQFDDRRETLRDLIYFRTDNAASLDNPSRNLCGRRSSGAAYIDCLSTFTHASANEVWMRADMNSSDASPGDCIGYRVAGGELSRFVGTNWRRCGPADAAGMSRTVLARGSGFQTTRNRAFFTYVLRYHPTMRRNTTVDPDRCRTFRPTPARGRSIGNQFLPFIAAVDIDFTGVTSVRAGDAEAGLTSSAAVSSHVAADHAFAVGCAP